MTIFQIKPVTIAVGDSFTLKFRFKNSNGTLPDLTDYNCFYVISPYGFEDTNIFSKQMSKELGSENVFSVALSTEDTAEFEPGAYTAKIVLECDGIYYKKARGSFNVLKDSEGVNVG